MANIFQASWNGHLIAVTQSSSEAPLIFSLLHQIFAAEPVADLKSSALVCGVSEDDVTVSKTITFLLIVFTQILLF